MAATDRVTPISGLLITMLQSSTIFNTLLLVYKLRAYMRANDIEWSCSLLKTVKLIAMYDFISRCILGIYTVNRKKGSTVISFIASRNISQFK